MVACRTLLSSAAAVAVVVAAAAATPAASSATAVSAGAAASDGAGVARFGSLFTTVDIGHKCRRVFDRCADRGVCEHGTCKRPVGPGARCGGSTDAVCVVGLTCEHGRCAGGQAEGEACSKGGSFAGTRVCARGKCKTTTTLCAAGLVCEHGTCKHA